MKNLLMKLFPYFKIDGYGKIPKIFLTILYVLGSFSMVMCINNFIVLLTNGYSNNLLTWIFIATSIAYLIFFIFMYKSINTKSVKQLYIAQGALIISFILLSLNIISGLLAGLIWSIPLYYLKRTYTLV
ncbi:MAG: hypothetical protein ACRC7N_12470 [Clostridium sp.]